MIRSEWKTYNLLKSIFNTNDANILVLVMLHWVSLLNTKGLLGLTTYLLLIETTQVLAGKNVHRPDIPVACKGAFEHWHKFSSKIRTLTTNLFSNHVVVTK